MWEKTWVYSPKPAQLDRFTKDILRVSIQKFIDSSKRLSQKVNRIEIKAGRIYLYHLVEPFIPKGKKVRWIKPLIEGKYFEYPLARITLFDKRGIICTADWQRHTGQWISLHKGPLNECLKFIQNDKVWFYDGP
jgi:hypothetical protein